MMPLLRRRGWRWRNIVHTDFFLHSLIPLTVTAGLPRCVRCLVFSRPRETTARVESGSISSVRPPSFRDRTSTVWLPEISPSFSGEGLSLWLGWLGHSVGDLQHLDVTGTPGPRRKRNALTAGEPGK